CQGKAADLHRCHVACGKRTASWFRQQQPGAARHAPPCCHRLSCTCRVVGREGRGKARNSCCSAGATAASPRVTVLDRSPGARLHHSGQLFTRIDDCVVVH